MVTGRTAKARGAAAERELLHRFYDAGWGAVRAAGSGSIPIEAPDVIAGHGDRSLAVEIKVCGNDRQYLKNQEIVDLLAFGERFGAEPWVAVKFLRRGWFFILATDMDSSGKHWVISYDDAKRRGRGFEKLIESKAEALVPALVA